MSISGPSSVLGSMPVISSATTPSNAQTVKPTDTQGPSFGDRVGDAIKQVANAQSDAVKAAKDYETGKTDDVAAVMVEQQVASLGFQMTLQVRNKALSAYRDIMNMPV